MLVKQWKCKYLLSLNILKGDIHTEEELVLKSGCSMKGDIYTCKLEIEPKALFNGACKTMEENIQPQGQSPE